MLAAGEIEADEHESRAAKLARFDKICSQIVPGQLFLGSDNVARNLELLKENGVTHILNTAGVACRNYHESHFEYKTLHLYDSPKQDTRRRSNPRVSPQQFSSHHAYL